MPYEDPTFRIWSGDELTETTLHALEALITCPMKIGVLDAEKVKREKSRRRAEDQRALDTERRQRKNSLIGAVTGKNRIKTLRDPNLW